MQRPIKLNIFLNIPGIKTGVIDGPDSHEAFPYEAGFPLKSLSIKVILQPLLIKYNAEDIPIIPPPTITIFFFLNPLSYPLTNWSSSFF